MRHYVRNTEFALGNRLSSPCFQSDLWEHANRILTFARYRAPLPKVPTYCEAFKTNSYTARRAGMEYCHANLVSIRCRPSFPIECRNASSSIN